jgi:H+/Na+-translocating ferredoxin:NAD+ oxidoreductase subunit B
LQSICWIFEYFAILTFIVKKSDLLIAHIDAVLPQTQCGQCSYPGCMPYAAAIAASEADINQCPPGGEAGIRALADLLDVPYKPLNTKYGVTKPKSIALIDEDICIGCTLCIQACPVDAILGASRQMHTVITAECTGCELCLAPCPVDCISMQPATRASRENVDLSGISLERQAADNARARHAFRLTRMAREKQERAQRRAQKIAASTEFAVQSEQQKQAEANKKSAIAAAIERVRIQKAGVPSLRIPDMDTRHTKAVAGQPDEIEMLGAGNVGAAH